MTTDPKDDAVGTPKRKLIEVALPLETVEYWVEHSVGPLQLPAGKLAHALEERVAVRVTLGQNGENQWGGGGGDEVFVDVHVPMHTPALNT